jgi:hypothetical protein
VPDTDGNDDIWFDTPVDDPEVGALFPLHEACMSIGCSAIDHIQSKSNTIQRAPALDILTSLINTRFKSRCRRVDLTTGTQYDIFDLCTCSNLYGPRSVLALARLEWWGGEYDV